MTHGPSTARKRERKRQAGAEPWQLDGCVVWPLLYAALGKTRECGASEVSGLPHQDTSSTMNLFLFFIFCLFCFLCFLFFSGKTFFALFDRGLREQSIWMVSIVHHYVVFFLFCPFCLYFFSAATCMRTKILCRWFGRMTAVNIYWVKYHHPYALQTFVDPSNKNCVHKKYFLCMSTENFLSK